MQENNFRTIKVVGSDENNSASNAYENEQDDDVNVNNLVNGIEDIKDMISEFNGKIEYIASKMEYIDAFIDNNVSGGVETREKDICRGYIGKGELNKNMNMNNRKENINKNIEYDIVVNDRSIEMSYNNKEDQVKKDKETKKESKRDKRDKELTNIESKLNIINENIFKVQNK